mmetsp:Transcript_2351/g.3288  ORF Transcript_2351/g.3288 Transcript_2351/m.3288 type:complete len:455 (+) Transcript_2351:237-1601(+)|eukprot:CAMPEP_0184874052 /NCGR_PEP_ID=MMETSP0580-20130426/42179_1 /TAXON_ID=1118495 /ORGANISM="Dactyliosolen fragilissimus" /LENGTH=454 /DNA_ID=CAMNT_0027377019 /DNA_START=128 /DNA_END=1492 /DNA_ORIENTATION=-
MSSSSSTGIQNDAFDFSYADGEENEIPMINDEDLADVNDDIDLRSNAPEDESVVHRMNDDIYPDKEAAMPSKEGGVIDDEIVREVLRSADEQIENENQNRIKKIIGLAIIAILSIFTITSIAFSGSKEKEIEDMIEKTGSAYDFEDKKDVVTINDKNDQDDIGIDLFVPALSNKLKNLKATPFDSSRGEIPIFWNVPSTGAVVQSVMTSCLKLVLASNHLSSDNEVLMVHNINGNLYVNVDLSVAPGIERAADLDLSKSGLADVYVTPHLNYVTNLLLGKKHGGRLFTVLRHPVDRAVNSYHTFMSETNTTLPFLEYAANYADSDWLTRFLSNERFAPISAGHLEVAKTILSQKCLIGIYSKLEESLERFETYFGWKVSGPRAPSSELCHETAIQNSHHRDSSAAMSIMNVNLTLGSPAYDLLIERNKYDLELYWYAYELFIEQKDLITNTRGI